MKEIKDAEDIALLMHDKAAGQEKYKKRALRFPIEAPLRYRIGGEFAWTEGSTVNISRSGILFRSDKEIPPKTMLQMCIVFPSELTGYDTTTILCWGPVVRNGDVNASGSGHTLAAAIIKYRFIQEDGPGLHIS